MKKREIEVTVRAVMVHRNKILFARARGEDYYFLPGGHVEFGELLEAALERELREEVNAVPRGPKLLGVVENRFWEKGRKRHEINFVYRASLDRYVLKALESHLSFHWVPAQTLKSEKILPIRMKQRLLVWVKR